MSCGMDGCVGMRSRGFRPARWSGGWQGLPERQSTNPAAVLGRRIVVSFYLIFDIYYSIFDIRTACSPPKASRLFLLLPAAGSGCAADPEAGPSFILGWVLLSLLCLGMLVLFAGVVRYLKRGAGKPPEPPQLDYEYDAGEEEEKEDKGG